MKTSQISLLMLCIFVGNLFLLCSCGKEGTDLKNQELPVESKSDTIEIDLSGRYGFAETIGETAGGTPIFFQYAIIVSKEDDQYQAKYEVDGYQTMQRLICSGGEIKTEPNENTSALTFSFDQYGEDDQFKTEDLFKTGQELFTLYLDHQQDEVKITFHKDYPLETEAGKAFTFKNLNESEIVNKQLQEGDISHYGIEEYYKLWVLRQKESLKSINAEDSWIDGRVEIKDKPNGYMKVTGLGGFTGWHTLTLWKPKNDKALLGVLPYGCGPICGAGTVSFYTIKEGKFVNVTEEVFPVQQQNELENKCLKQTSDQPYPESGILCWKSLPRVGTSIQIGTAKLNDNNEHTFQKIIAELKYNVEDGSFKLSETTEEIN